MSSRCARAWPRSAVGVQTEEIDRSDVAEMWPFADLSPFAAFGWEARGGYGDAYQTAQAFAVSARAAGVRIRQGATVTDLVVDGDAVTGIRLADGTTVSAGAIVVATGVWTKPFLEPYGVDVPIRVVREQIVTIDPGVETGNVPVFSDLVSLQYVRPEVGGDISATATCSTSSRPTRTTTSTVRPRRSSTSPWTSAVPGSLASAARRSAPATRGATTSRPTGIR